MAEEYYGLNPGVEPDEMHGDLSKIEIITAAAECVLRAAKGECTLSSKTY